MPDQRKRKESSAILTVSSTYRFQNARRPFMINISQGPDMEWLVCTRIEDAHRMRVRRATRRWRLLVWVLHLDAHIKWAYRDIRNRAWRRG